MDLGAMSASKVVGRVKKAPFYWGLWYFLNRVLAKTLFRILRLMGFNESVIFAIVERLNFQYIEREKCFVGLLAGVKFKMVIDDRRAMLVPMVGTDKFPIKDIHYTFPTREIPRFHRTVKFQSAIHLRKLIDKLGEDNFAQIFGFRAGDRGGELRFVKEFSPIITPRLVVRDLDNLLRILVYLCESCWKSNVVNAYMMF